MKQKFKLLTAFLCGALFFSSVSFAASELKARVTDYSIVYNGEKLEISDPVVSIDSKSHIPLRGVLEELGYKVGFNEGVITLDDQSVEESEQTTNESKYDFNSLPMTKINNGIEVTVHSMTINSESTDFDITVTNSFEWDVPIDFSQNSVFNHSVANKEMKRLGTVDKGVFKSPVKAGDTVRGIVKKSALPDDAINVVFRGSFGTSGVEFPISIN